MTRLAGADFVFLEFVVLADGFTFAFDEGFSEFLTTGFPAGFATLLFTGFDARSLAAAMVCSRFAIIADFSLLTRVKSSTRS